MLPEDVVMSLTVIYETTHSVNYVLVHVPQTTEQCATVVCLSFCIDVDLQ